MPKFSFAGFGSDVLEAEAGTFTAYDGEIPPNGTILKGKIKRLVLKLNKNNDPMLNCVFEATGNAGGKNAKYDGISAWWNGNVTAQGAGYINQFLAALGAAKGFSRDEMVRWFWKNGLRLEDTKPTKEGTVVLAIGKLKIDPDGMPIIISSKKGTYKGEASMDVGSWLIPRDTKPATDEDAEGDEAEDDEDGLEEAFEDDDSTEDDEEFEGDEEEDEAEGVVSPSKAPF